MLSQPFTGSLVFGVCPEHVACAHVDGPRFTVGRMTMSCTTVVPVVPVSSRRPTSVLGLLRDFPDTPLIYITRRLGVTGPSGSISVFHFFSSLDPLHC